GLLTIDNIRRDVDSGKYICIAIADFGKDTIEYTVDVKSLPITLPEEVSCSESHSINAILISKILRIGNDSALVRWEYPPRHFNASCYERISLGWWTSEKDGSFLEIPTSFSERETVLEGLKEGLRYFVQVHLKKNSEDGVGGETRSFILEDLMWGDSTSDPREMRFSLPLLLIAAFIFCFLLLAIGVGYYVLYHKKKKSRKRLFPCCGTSLGEKKLRKRGGGAIYNHPDYRDFQLIQSPPRGIDDFMQNLAPQWPEPEPPAKLGLEEPSHPEETTALFKPQANGVVSPHTAGPVHPSQNNSISSSWSSLFNMPIDPANVRMSGHHKSKFPGFVT
ncbi:Hemicentin1like, partial [Caligus rogercresseyi]